MANFVRVGEAGDVAGGDVTSYSVGDRAVAVANVGGTLYAFDDECTHQGCLLAVGDLGGSQLECTCRGRVFDVTSGAVLNGRATEPVATFEVREQDGELQIAAD